MRTAIVAANVNQPKGNIDGPRQDFTLASNDQLLKADTFRPIVVAYKNGAAVRLVDVAKVIDGAENANLAGWANKDRAVILNVQRQPGANVIAVADRVKALLPQLKSALPQSVDVKILSDRTETVRASVEDVEFTLVLTIGLVVLVIFAFLRNLRATAIPSVAVPLSLVGTFGVMYALGYSLDNLSLMALTISTGFVVDDAIVMIENIARYIEDGEAPFEAALKGSKQIGFTIISLTVSLVAVLIPLLFMGGVIGRLFREFAVTLSVAIGVSAVLSLTLTPMMCAHLLAPEPPPEERGAVLCALRARLRRDAADLRLRPEVGARAPANDAPRAPSRPSRSPWCSRSACRKASSRSRTPGLIIGITEAPPDVSFPRMMTLQQRARRRRDSAGPGRRQRRVLHRLRRHERDDQQRPHLDHAQAARKKERHANADEIIARLRRSSPRSPGIERTCRPSRTCRSTPVSAAHSSSTPWKTRIRSSLPPGPRRWWTS